MWAESWAEPTAAFCLQGSLSLQMSQSGSRVSDMPLQQTLPVSYMLPAYSSALVHPGWGGMGEGGDRVGGNQHRKRLCSCSWGLKWKSGGRDKKQSCQTCLNGDVCNLSLARRRQAEPPNRAGVADAILGTVLILRHHRWSLVSSRRQKLRLPIRNAPEVKHPLCAGDLLIPRVSPRASGNHSAQPKGLADEAHSSQLTSTFSQASVSVCDMRGLSYTIPKAIGALPVGSGFRAGEKAQNSFPRQTDWSFLLGYHSPLGPVSSPVKGNDSGS